MDIELIHVLYIVLIIFFLVVGTLLSIVLYRVMKILDPVKEIVEDTRQIKNKMQVYAQVPNIVKNKFFNVFGNK